jgi:putative spermidine/putrescine transport system permease protein
VSTNTIAGVPATPRPPLRARLRARGFDGITLLALPAVLFVIAMFVLPFAYGLILSFSPTEGSWISNYVKFFEEPSLCETVWTTLRLALPVTILSIVLSVPVAMRVRLMKRQRLLTTILVLPMTLGTVLIADGLLTYLGPNGWLNMTLMHLGLISEPVRLIHNYTGVALSLVLTGFPFTFLLTLSYVAGIDQSLERAAAMLGANTWQRFAYVFLPLLVPGLAVAFCLSFTQAFSVFPSAVLLGAPAGPTRVISIVAYQAAFEDYDYSLASAIAMLMCAIQLIIVAIVMGIRSMFYRGSVAGAKG